MKKAQIVVNIILVLAVGYSIYMGMGKKSKTAYIDNNVLVNEYKGMKDARQDFEVKAAQWQANVDTLFKKFEEELKRYEKEHAKMTKKERELKEQLLRNRQQQIEQYKMAMQQKAQEEEQKQSQTVFNEINDYIKEYGKEHGYTFIFGATGAGNILYADEDAVNITKEVLEGLNKAYQPGQINAPSEATASAKADSVTE